MAKASDTAHGKGLVRCVRFVCGWFMGVECVSMEGPVPEGQRGTRWFSSGRSARRRSPVPRDGGAAREHDGLGERRHDSPHHRPHVDPGLCAQRTRAIMDPWQTLGIAPTSDLSTVKAAHRRLVLQHHPDVRRTERSERDAHAEFLSIQRAYELVMGRRHPEERGDDPHTSGWDFHDWCVMGGVPPCWGGCHREGGRGCSALRR